MSVDQRTAGRFAIASGVVTIMAAAVLVIFFLVEAPGLVESGDVDRITVFGSTNDALIAVALALLLPVAIFVARTGEPRRLHRGAGLVGLAGLGLGTVFMVTTAIRVIDYGINTLLIGVAFALVGSWLLALNVPAGATALFSREPGGQGSSPDSPSSRSARSAPSRGRRPWPIRRACWATPSWSPCWAPGPRGCTWRHRSGRS